MCEGVHVCGCVHVCVSLHAFEHIAVYAQICRSVSQGGSRDLVFYFLVFLDYHTICCANVLRRHTHDTQALPQT